MHLRSLATALLLGTTVVWPTQAQTSATGDGAPSERARRDADKVFQMILQHADKPRRAREDKGGTTAVDKTAAPATAGATPASLPVLSLPAAVPRAEAELALGSPVPVMGLGSAGASPSHPSIESVASAPAAALPAATPASARQTRLELLTSVEPEFPARLLRGLGQGSVVVQFEVRPDGSVARADVLRSPHRGLNEAALAAVLAWRFKPLSEPVTGVVDLRLDSN